jgi:type VI secretion system protein
MLFDRSLLERIETASDVPLSGAAAFDKSVFINSILRNVRRMLNERWGSCECRADYGLPDINEALNNGGSPAQFALTIQKTIELFEPRLSGVLVRLVPDADHPMRIHFRIMATMHFGESSERLAFETILSEDKRIRVQG